MMTKQIFKIFSLNFLKSVNTRVAKKRKISRKIPENFHGSFNPGVLDIWTNKYPIFSGFCCRQLKWFFLKMNFSWSQLWKIPENQFILSISKYLYPPWERTKNCDKKAFEILNIPPGGPEGLGAGVRAPTGQTQWYWPMQMEFQPLMQNSSAEKCVKPAWSNIQIWPGWSAGSRRAYCITQDLVLVTHRRSPARNHPTEPSPSKQTHQSFEPL